MFTTYSIADFIGPLEIWTVVLFWIFFFFWLTLLYRTIRLKFRIMRFKKLKMKGYLVEKSELKNHKQSTKDWREK